MSIAHDIFRVPHVVEVGCFRNLYTPNTSKELKTIGYVGAIQQNYNTESVDIKRGYLVKRVSELTETPLIHFKGLHFLGNEQFYTKFDILMFSSFTEGLPTVAIESICGGIPIIGTHTGIFPDLAKSGAGIILPFDEKEYIEQAVETINELKNNPEKYQYMSECAYKESEKYDWSHKKQSWLKFIDSLYQ
jgi:glycosyltransferase involved in cell wall biosynthesis